MFDNKDSNPKTGAGSLKPAMEFVPPVALLALAGAHRHGAEKYGAFNWRELGVSETTYYSAMHRHLACWFDGEETDPESGEHHLAHVMACCAIILDAGTLGQLNRDRPSPGNAAAEVILRSILRQSRLGEKMGATAEKPDLNATGEVYRAATEAAQADEAKRKVSKRPDIARSYGAPGAATTHDFSGATYFSLRPGDTVMMKKCTATGKSEVCGADLGFRLTDDFDNLSPMVHTVHIAGTGYFGDIVRRVEHGHFLEAQYTSSRGRHFAVQGGPGMKKSDARRLKWRVSCGRFDFVTILRNGAAPLRIETSSAS